MFNNCIWFVLSEKHSIKHAFILMQFNSCKHDTTAQMKEINTFNKQVCIKMIKSDSKVFCIFTNKTKIYFI